MDLLLLLILLLNKALNMYSLVGTEVYSCKCVSALCFPGSKDVVTKILIDHELNNFRIGSRKVKNLNADRMSLSTKAYKCIETEPTLALSLFCYLYPTC